MRDPMLKKEHYHGRAERQVQWHGYGNNQLPTPGNLFTMGWLRAPMKEFIQFYKSPKKKNNLISKASILLYSRLSPNLTAIKTIQYRPPCAFCWVPSCPIHPPSLPCVFGWLLCLFVDWGPPKTTTNFVFLIFLPPIWMGWLRAPMKDFIQFCKLPKKKII